MCAKSCLEGTFICDMQVFLCALVSSASSSHTVVEACKLTSELTCIQKGYIKTQMYCIVLYCIVLYRIVSYRTELYCIVLYCIVLYCIVLYCIVCFEVCSFVLLFCLSFFDSFHL